MPSLKNGIPAKSKNEIVHHIFRVFFFVVVTVAVIARFHCSRLWVCAERERQRGGRDREEETPQHQTLTSAVGVGLEPGLHA